MKKQLQLFILTMLFSVSFINAQKTDVWDFGGAVLDANLYNNQLTATNINDNFYLYSATIVKGTASSNNVLNNASGYVIPLTAGLLTFRANTNDRFYTNDLTVTRYATGNIGVSGLPDYTARIYCNGNASSTVRFFTMTLNEDDEVTFIARADAAADLTFANAASGQLDVVALTTSGTAVTEAKFVAKTAGTYKISSLNGKGSYYRILRKPASYSTVTGNIDITAASGISNGYSLVFTNTAGKSWNVPVNAGTYSASLPVGYTYTLSLLNANGYIISNGTTLNVSSSSTQRDISILKVDLYTVSGNVTGLGANITKPTLSYTPIASANKIYVPKPVINTSSATYSVELEPNTQYTISATGVNDYEILSNTVVITGATTADVAFTLKPLYPIAINANGLTPDQIANLSLTFTNVNESGYVYTFAPGTAVNLRTGTYAISYTGLDAYQVELGLTSNLKVVGAATSKALEFKPTKVWSFDDKTITTTTTLYKGMQFSGTAAAFAGRLANGDLTAKTGGIIKVPVKVGEKITISYYFAANFSIDGGTPIVTSSGSTSIVENVDYAYPGTSDGFVTITMGGTALTSYLTEIKIGGIPVYTPVLTVGAGKDYSTINAALDVASRMVRTASQRVTIMIDPGNYQEMIDITTPNITFKNASLTPSIALANQGVDINAQAVRITSYYGNGYNYYSMKNNQKWDADILRVNKDNGSATYVNQSGTTNNSYWNATLIVSANGFEAENIILENSFNQYISSKEANDILVEVPGVTKGLRPTTQGSVAVQNRSFVERAAAIAIKNGIDKTVLNNCRVVGRQDAFFGGTTARVAVYKGVMMGAVDYIFGGMNVVFYKSDLAMNTSDVAGDASYLTAPQQSTGRGYLMYECKITSAIPAVETASVYTAKPGFFGRPWAANTSEVVMYNTTIETSNYPGNIGESLITPIAWNNSLSGTSAKMYEYGTNELSGVNNNASRATWATLLTAPTLTDGTAITTFNFTKGTDNWDPFPALIAADPLGTKKFQDTSSVNVYANKNNVTISNVKSNTKVFVYGLNGALVKSFTTDTDTNFDLKAGIWIVVVKAVDGQKSVKLITY